MIIETVDDQSKIDKLRSTLDRGESEAIVLSLTLQAHYLLMDEKLGRQVAKAAGVKVIGRIGVLLLAKKKGLLSSVTEQMDALRTIGFWISDALYEKVKQFDST